jgi:alanine racemase
VPYLLSHIATIIYAETFLSEDMEIENLLIDSRKFSAVHGSLFFALKGRQRDGHLFIEELYKRGLRNFVISTPTDHHSFPGANFLLVSNTLEALQQLAAYHRSRFSIPVIGITGSNGKTIVKEWLYQLLHDDYHIIRSPKSYNSQIGVPLSVWQINKTHTLAIFEAGISQPGEMEKLEKIIQPTIGVLTNIGEAHSEGFGSLALKEKEKRKLFSNAVIPAQLSIIEIKKGTSTTKIVSENNQFVEIPFTDDASVQNAITCWQVLVHLGIPPEQIHQRMKMLQPVNMRLELKKGINHCSVINDSYSADLSSLEIALNFLDQQSNTGKKTVILSDFLQSSVPDDELYTQVAALLQRHKVSRLIGIGEKITVALAGKKGEMQTDLFPTKEKFLAQFRSSQFSEETILVKGVRVFAFEEIVQLLELKSHQTVLEINLNAIAHNLKEYQKQLKASTKIMAMVKAFAYGSGGAEIAGILQYNKVDYLGVAYADEGVELRKAGIHLPIMVMNPEENAFEKIIEYNLEPELYSFALLNAFDSFIRQQGLSQYPVHIEMETGMNRLGFNVGEIDRLSQVLLSSDILKVQSVFTHLAAAEEAANDEFSLQQFKLFENAVNEIKKQTGFSFISHIANSAAAIRHPQMQMDMVRLGIGLYGVNSTGSEELNLQTVATLKSTIAQIKKIQKGESVSYNRREIVNRDSLVATVRIGYADGFPRSLGNGTGKVLIHGKRAPVSGTVCMDMFMADITDIEGVNEGDEVIIFGKELPVQQLAEWAGTIPYEIMTGISQRVKRVYYTE